VLEHLELSSQHEINIADINVIEFEPLEDLRNSSTIDQNPVLPTSQSPKVINYCNSLMSL